MFVYVANNKHVVKVGRTDDLNRRMQELKPFKPVTHIETYKQRAETLEIAVHTILRALNLTEERNEYFRTNIMLPTFILGQLSTALMGRDNFVTKINEYHEQKIVNKEKTSGFLVGLTFTEPKLVVNEPKLYYFSSLFHILEYRDRSDKAHCIMIGRDFMLDMHSPNFEEAWDIEVPLEVGLKFTRFLDAVKKAYRDYPDMIQVMSHIFNTKDLSKANKPVRINE